MCWRCLDERHHYLRRIQPAAQRHQGLFGAIREPCRPSIVRKLHARLCACCVSGSCRIAPTGAPRWGPLREVRPPPSIEKFGKRLHAVQGMIMTIRPIAPEKKIQEKRFLRCLTTLGNVLTNIYAFPPTICWHSGISWSILEPVPQCCHKT